MTRVLIVDDHAFFRECLVDLLNASADLEAVGECEDGTDVPAAVRRFDPDVVLMDVQMHRCNGLEAVAELTAMRTAVRVIMLSSDRRASTQNLARSRGAAGFLIKGDDDGALLLTAIRSVAGGSTVWPDEALRRRS